MGIRLVDREGATWELSEDARLVCVNDPDGDPDDWTPGIPVPLADVERAYGPFEVAASEEPLRHAITGDQATPARFLRPSFDEYYLAGAAWAATRADCTRAQVGAILVSREHRTSLGYNGLISGLPGCATAGNCPRGRLTVDQVPRDSDYGNCAATHAERNAIERARPEDLPGATIYTTRAPCPACWTLIRASGIGRVVTPAGDVT